MANNSFSFFTLKQFVKIDHRTIGGILQCLCETKDALEEGSLRNLRNDEKSSLSELNKDNLMFPIRLVVICLNLICLAGLILSVCFFRKSEINRHLKFKI